MSGIRVFILIATTSALLGALPEPTLQPRTITTQDRQGAVILWDATPFVEYFVQRATSQQDAIEALESDAVGLFVRNAPLLGATQHHLRVVVSYVQTGATEERYQTKTFAGVKAILTVEGNISRHMHFSRGWQSDLQRGILPRGVHVEVSRDLP
jgi:hypothetical protein